MAKVYKNNPYHNRDEIIGQKFWKWTVLSRISFGCFLMECECGHTMKKRSIDVCRGRSTQCGRCRRKELRGMKDERIEKGTINLMSGKWSNSIYSIKKEDLDE